MSGITRAQLVQWRVIEELSAAEIGAKLGLTGEQASALLARHAIKLSPDAVQRLSAKGTAKGRAAAADRRKGPSDAQKAWGTGRSPSMWQGAKPAKKPTGDRPKVTGTDMSEMIARALASGYPVTVGAPAHADGCKKLAFGTEVG